MTGWLAVAGLTVVGLLVVWFFRSPPRRVPTDAGLILAPADGRVVAIDEIEHDEFLGGPAVQIGIFLSIFNVHVNRVPRGGRVVGLGYFPGAFLDARHPDCPVRNEQLDTAAQKHAENMARQDKLTHELDGKRSKDRVIMEGYSARVVAENIAQAPAGAGKSPAAVVEAWRYSPGHYKNILLEPVTETGIGVAKGKSGQWYYCQVFAAPKK